MTKLDPSQAGADQLLYSTYLGGAEYEESFDIAVDSNGYAYVTGVTESTDFPTINPYQAYPGDSNSNVFIASFYNKYIFTILPSDITSTTAQSGGYIIYDGSSPIIEKGVCWSTDSEPDLTDSQTSDGTGPSNFISFMTDLLPATTYHFRAYITTSEKTFYGDQGNFTTTAGIKFTSPNGGQNWTKGTTQDITWSAGGFNGNLKITLWKGGTLVGIIATGVDSTTGTYSWTVGQYNGGTAAIGTDYRIKIKEIGTSIADSSDADFSLN